MVLFLAQSDRSDCGGNPLSGGGPAGRQVQVGQPGPFSDGSGGAELDEQSLGNSSSHHGRMVDEISRSTPRPSAKYRIIFREIGGFTYG
jgi:hypothetical protein